MVIAPQVVMTKTRAPPMYSLALQPPAVQLAPTLQSLIVLRGMAVVLQAAIALTTTTVLQPAPITSSRRESSAMAIVQPPVRIQLPVLPILSTALRQTAMSLVFSRISPPVVTEMDVAQAAAIIITTPTAVPFAVIAL